VIKNAIPTDATQTVYEEPTLSTITITSTLEDGSENVSETAVTIFANESEEDPVVTVYADAMSEVVTNFVEDIESYITEVVAANVDDPAIYVDDYPLPNVENIASNADETIPSITMDDPASNTSDT
jgi:hypothetical protein